MEEERDDQASDTPVAVEKWVDRFKFGMDDGQLYQPIRRIGVNIGIPSCHHTLNAVSAGWHETRLLDCAAFWPDTIGNAAIFARILVAATDSIHQYIISGFYECDEGGGIAGLEDVKSVPEPHIGARISGLSWRVAQGEA